MGEILHLPIVRCGTLAGRRSTTWRRTASRPGRSRPTADANSLFDMGMPDEGGAGRRRRGPGPHRRGARARTQFDVRIPMHRGVDSLNLGHALAIAMAAVALPVPD